MSLGVKSLAMIAMMAAANRPQELRVHLKGALKNGCTPEEIREILLLVALYCGIPAANEAHRAAMDVLKEGRKGLEAFSPSKLPPSPGLILEEPAEALAKVGVSKDEAAGILRRRAFGAPSG